MHQCAIVDISLPPSISLFPPLSVSQGGKSKGVARGKGNDEYCGCCYTFCGRAPESMTTRVQVLPDGKWISACKLTVMHA